MLSMSETPHLAAGAAARGCERRNRFLTAVNGRPGWEEETGTGTPWYLGTGGVAWVHITPDGHGYLVRVRIGDGPTDEQVRTSIRSAIACAEQGATGDDPFTDLYESMGRRRP